MTDHPTHLSRAEVAADWLVTQARDALAEYGDPARAEGNSRKTAVTHLATSAARTATAQVAATDAHELTAAHWIIAELAARLAGQSSHGTDGTYPRWSSMSGEEFERGDDRG
jgi:hypothetical protein